MVSANSDGDDKKRRSEHLFDHGRRLEAEGKTDAAIEMFLSGLMAEPDNLSAHRELRTIALKRTAAGGKSLGMMEAIRLKRRRRNDLQNLINAEKLMTFEPGNIDHMVAFRAVAERCGLEEVSDWAESILRKATAPSGG